MKIIQFFKRMNMSSNAIVELFNVDTQEQRRLFYCEIKELPEWMKSGKINSFTIRDNVLTIYFEA